MLQGLHAKFLKTLHIMLVFIESMVEEFSFKDSFRVAKGYFAPVKWF